MTLQQLRYLLALDDHRHFGRAAASCFVSQPTLTLQLKKLEEDLGAQLFDRVSKPISPTPLGARVIAQARIILNEERSLRALVSEESELLTGEFTLGIIPTLAPSLLPLFIRSFSNSFPDLRLRIREMQSEEIIDGLNRHQIDIGLLVTPLEEKQLREVVLFYEPFLIYARPDSDILQHSPLLPDHVQRQELWLLQRGHCFRNQVLNICGEDNDHKLHPNFAFEAGSIETLKNMVRSNPGYTIVPEMSVHPERDASFVKRFAEPQPAREVSIVVHKNFTRERLVTELRKAILEAVPDDFRKNKRFMGVAWR